MAETAKTIASLFSSIGYLLIATGVAILLVRIGGYFERP
jgi:hypothetical protein